MHCYISYVRGGFEFRRARVTPATNGFFSDSSCDTMHLKIHYTTPGTGETSELLIDNNLLCHCIFANFLHDMPGPVKFPLYLFLHCAWYIGLLPRNVEMFTALRNFYSLEQSKYNRCHVQCINTSGKKKFWKKYVHFNNGML